jgi:hypothetical protein
MGGLGHADSSRGFGSIGARPEEEKSSSELTDEIIKRMLEDEDYASRYLAKKGLTEEEAADVQAAESDPGFWAKAMGVLDVIDAPGRAVIANTWQRSIEDTAKNNPSNDTFAEQMKGMGELGGRMAASTWLPNILGANLWDKPEKYVNPLEAIPASLRGENPADLTVQWQETADAPWNSREASDVMNNPWVAGIAGTALNIGSSPTTYLSGGIGSATKVARSKKLATLVKDGITAAKLADVGIKPAEWAAKFGIDAKRLETGIEVSEIPREASQDVYKAVTKWAQASAAGKKRDIGIPLLRQGVDEAGNATGKYGLGTVLPTITKNLDEAGNVVKDAEGTLLERAGLQFGMKTAGKTGVRKTISAGTRGADEGGIKFMGQSITPSIKVGGKTLPSGQDVIEGASGWLWRTLNTNDGYTAAKRLVSQHAELDHAGDRLVSAWGRMAQGERLNAASKGTQLAGEATLSLSRRMTDAEARELGAGIERVLPQSAYTEVSAKVTQKAGLVKQRDRLMAQYRVFDEEDKAAALGKAGTEAAKANAKLEAIALKRADALDALASSLELSGAAGTASGVRAAAASLKGQQTGFAAALREAEKAVSLARKDVDTLVNRSAKLKQSAASRAASSDTLLAEAKAALTERKGVQESIPLSAQSAPDTIDTYLAAEYPAVKADASEADTWAAASVKDYMKRHAFNADDPMAEEIRRTLTASGEGNILPKSTSKQRVALADFTAHMSERAGDAGHGALFSDAMSDTDILEAVGEAIARANKGPSSLTIDEIVDAVGPDAVIDGIVAHIREAIEIGDFETAMAWQKLADDFAGRLEYRAAADPWDAAGNADPGSAPRVTPEAVESVKTKADTARNEIDAAYARGMARAERSGARTAVSDAWKAADRTASAESRSASFSEKIASLGDESSRQRALSNRMQSLETELKNLAKDAAVQEDRFRRGSAASSRVQKTIALIEEKQREIDTLASDITGIFSQQNYGLITEHLVGRGIEPARAAELTRIAEGIRDELNTVLSQKQALGIGDAEHLTGQGSAGYFPHTEPGYETLLQSLARKAGIPTEEYKNQKRITEEVFGVDYDALKRDDGKSMNAAAKTARVKQPELRTDKTLAERIGTPDAPGRVTNLNVAQAVGQKLRGDYTAIANTRFQDDLVASVGKKAEQSLDEIGEAAGMTREQVMKAMTPDEWRYYTIERGGKKIDYLIPEQIGRWLDTYEKVFINDESTSVFLRGYDRIQNKIKGMQTMWRPAFHIRNIGSNWFLAFSQGLGDPASFEDGIELIAAVKGGIGDKVFFDIGGQTKSAQEIYDAIDGSVIRGMVGQADTGQTVIKEARMFNPRKNVLAEAGRTLNPQRVGTLTGQMIEDSGRVGVYMAAVRKGIDEEAARLVPDKVLYNYMPENQTNFEREVIKRFVMPYWTWFKNNLPQQIQNMVKNPGRIGWYDKMRGSFMTSTGTDEGDLPEYQREGMWMPIPGKDGKVTMLSPSLLPSADIAKIGGGLGTLFSGMSVPAKTTAELALNYNTFSGQKIEQFPGDSERAPWYLSAVDSIMGDSGQWKRFRDHTGMVRMEDEETGEVYLAMPAKARKALRDFIPFAETVGSMLGDSTEKEDQRRLTVFSGITASPFDEDAAQEARIARYKKLVRDEIKRIEQDAERDGDE